MTYEQVEAQAAVALGRSVPAAVENLVVGAPPAAPWAWGWDWEACAYRLFPRIYTDPAWLAWRDRAWLWSESGETWRPVWPLPDARHRPDCVVAAMLAVFDLRTRAP